MHFHFTLICLFTFRYTYTLRILVPYTPTFNLSANEEALKTMLLVSKS